MATNPSTLALHWLRNAYPEVWGVDFEFRQTPEGCPVPLCMVAREVFGRHPALRLFSDELPKKSPINFDIRSLFISFASPAELSCFIELGWQFPRNVLDLYVEFLMEQNTIGTKTARRSLLHALAYYGLDGMDYTEKEELRDLILTRKTYTPEERIRILDYCQQDVLAIEDLLPHMLPRIPGLIECIKSSSKKVPGWSQALFRGRYMAAVTKMTKVGVPIDVELYGRVLEVRPQIRQRLINETNAKYDVYDGDKFKLKKFAELIRKLDIWWPVTQTKKPKTDEETFKMMSLAYPELEDLVSAKRAIGELNSSSLVVKADGYSRAWLGPFLANTGRNLPRKSEDGGRFIFGMSAWFRSFIRPREGRAIAYVDWSQQEVAIMAGLSRDPAMIAAYNSGDCYLEFAKGVGAVPPTATKKSHPRERELYKTCFLAMPYGQGDKSLARRLKVSLVEAQDMIAAHRDLYHVFWQWTEINTVHAPHKGEIFTPLGWRMRIVDMDGQKKASGKIHSNYRTLLNWPMQSVGADMMRLAACMASEGGLRIAAPIHDAFLLESSIDNIEGDVQKLQDIMMEASRIVLRGVITCRSDAQIIRYPDRYVDERGAEMWNRVIEWMKDYENRQ